MKYIVKMGVDFRMYEKFFIYGSEDLTDESIQKLQEWVSQQDDDKFYSWDIEYNFDVIIIGLNESVKGSVDDWIEMLLPFLSECQKYTFSLEGVVPFTVSWGDSESGVIYINSEDKKILIHTIGNDGDINNRQLEWK